MSELAITRLFRYREAMHFAELLARACGCGGVAISAGCRASRMRFFPDVRPFEAFGQDRFVISDCGI
jgi:hypothetical protein